MQSTRLWPIPKQFHVVRRKLCLAERARAAFVCECIGYPTS